MRLKYQVDKGLVARIKAPTFSIVAHQNAARVANKMKNITNFYTVEVRNSFVESDGVRYPKDSIDIIHFTIEYLAQYSDFELFYKQYFGETLLNPFTTDTDMRKDYPIQIMVVRFQFDNINPQKFQLF